MNIQIIDHFAETFKHGVEARYGRKYFHDSKVLIVQENDCIFFKIHINTKAGKLMDSFVESGCIWCTFHQTRFNYKEIEEFYEDMPDRLTCFLSVQLKTLDNSFCENTIKITIKSGKQKDNNYDIW